MRFFRRAFDYGIKYESYFPGMYRWGVGGLAALLLVLGAAPSPARAQEGGEEAPVSVAVIADPGPAADSVARRLRDELRALFSARRTVRIRRMRAEAAWTPPTVRDLHRRAVANAPDALVVVGPVATAAVCVGASAPGAGADVPVIAVPTGGGILDPDVGDACDAAEPLGAEADPVEAVRRVAAVDTLVVAADARVADPLPGLAERRRALERRADLTVRLARLDPDSLALSLPGGPATAVLLEHTDRLAPAAVGRLVARLTEEGHPVFGTSAALVREHEALAAYTGRVSRARPAALAVEAAVTGTPPPAGATTPSEGRLLVHRGVADRLGIELPWDLRVEATLVGAPRPARSPLTLAASMRKSIGASLQLRAKRQETAAQAHGADEARAQLLPQINARATGTAVSEEAAAASFGARPERGLTSALSFRQVLFSEPAFARWSVERRMQAVREFEQRAVRLDAAQTAADAYLGVLRARSAVRIQRENLRVVRTNLRAARTRRAAGAAGPQAVSRLETQEARAEQGLLRALGRERTAEIRYNRTLNRPLDAPVRLDRTVGVDPRPLLEQFPYEAVLDRPTQAEAFRTFWVEEARTRAPEVQALDRLVGARKRQLASAERSFWLPTVSLEGAVSQRMYEDGSGTSGLELPLSGGGPGGGSFSVPTPPDRQWSLSLTASFPLFNGLERAARERRASDQLAASRTRRTVAALGVEQSVRTALVDLETSHEAVERALRAADAARRTLDVTQAAYREGTASLVDLIDAQSAALATRQEAADAAYGLLRDWVAVQRAAGSFRVLRTAEEQAAFEQRLRQFLPSTAAGRR